jgi:hypothetical protein
MSNDAILWGIDKKTWPELYQLPLWQLGAETERLRTLATQGSRHAKHRLDTIQRIFDERAALEEAVWKQRNNHNGGGDVHYHNTVTNSAPAQSSSMSTATAIGLGAGAAALVFVALSGVAFLAILGLFTALLILTILGVAYLLHRRNGREFPYQAPQFAAAETLQPLAVASETQDIRRIEHKPMRAIAMQEVMEPTPLVRKSTAVSTVHHTNNAVGVRK